MNEIWVWSGRNDTDMGKLRYWLRNLSQCHFVQHTSQTDWPGINLRPLRVWSVPQNLHSCTTAQTVTSDRFLNSLSTNVLQTTLGAYRKDVPQHYNGLQHCCVINSNMNHRQVSFYARVTSWKGHANRTQNSNWKQRISWGLGDWRHPI